MNQKKVTRQTTVRGITPEDFDRRINEILAGHDGVKIERETSIPMMAYLTYSEIVEEAETLREDYLLAGCTLTCGSCPIIRKSDDKRRKKHFCPEKQATVRLDMYCCETFFKKVEEGTIIIDRIPELEIA